MPSARASVGGSKTHGAGCSSGAIRWKVAVSRDLARRLCTSVTPEDSALHRTPSSPCSTERTGAPPGSTSIHSDNDDQPRRWPAATACRHDDVNCSSSSKGLGPMCRKIKRLRHPDQAPTDAELHDAAVQFVRKISGFHAPSKAYEAAFNHPARAGPTAGRSVL